MFSWKLPSDPPRLDPGSLACLGDALPDAQREEDPADGQAGRMGGRLIEMESANMYMQYLYIYIHMCVYIYSVYIYTHILYRYIFIGPPCMFKSFER